MVLTFSRSALIAISAATPKNLLPSRLWRTLCSAGVSRTEPTRRACRAGTRKQRTPSTSICSTEMFDCSPGNLSLPDGLSSNSSEIQNLYNLHISSSTTLNIQIDTLSNGIQNNGSLKAVPSTLRDPSRELSNGSHAPKCSFVPKLMVANTMSLVPKITEIQEFVTRKDVSLAFITETWLRESIADSVVDIPGYIILRKRIGQLRTTVVSASILRTPGVDMKS